MKARDPLAWLFRLTFEFNLAASVAMVGWLVWAAPQVLAGGTARPQYVPLHPPGAAAPATEPAARPAPAQPPACECRSASPEIEA